MIYFDNSATTRVKPKEVISACLKGITKYSANPGRSAHKLSIMSGMEVIKVREKVRQFVNCPKIENIIFTQNCTEALNLAILGSAKKGHVICSINEHNSVLRPLNFLKEKQLIEISYAEPQKEDIFTWSDIEKHLRSDTYLICVNHISNVDGMIANIEEIGRECKNRNILFLVDGAQSAGHVKLDMEKDNITFLALAPHKALYAPQGIGVLAVCDTSLIQPIKFGGTGTDSFSLVQPTGAPECFESGTLSVMNILGLGAGIDFVNKNFDEIHEKIEDLTTYLNFELRKIDNVVVYTHPNNSYGVISFTIKGYESEEVAGILSENYNICVRGGLQCAPLKHTFQNTLQTGTVRVSLSYFNNFSEIIVLIKAIKKIAEKAKK